MKIESINEKFISCTEVNNTEWKLDTYILSNGNKSYSLVLNDFLKYPDKFQNLLKSFPHFDNDITRSARPGKGFLFHDEWLDGQLTYFLRKAIFDKFRINTKINTMFTNCFPGITEEDEKVHVAPPHTDTNHFIIESSSNLVTNLGLTKDVVNNGTSFWSFRGKRGILEMSKKELNEYTLYTSDIKKNDVFFKSWYNTEDSVDWKFEYFVPMGYNSLVCYSPTWFHQPSYDKNYFVDRDRFSLATFYKIRMELVNEIPEELIPEAYDIWNKFDVTTMTNYYF